jgi:acyl-CoA synthetase (AMP-forming)/AMP-acid ligase II
MLAPWSRGQRHGDTRSWRRPARWALFVDTPAEFAAALFGAWHAGKHVVLPGDARPDTLAALREQVDGMAGDLPQGLQPSATESPLQWPRLDARETWITLFTSGSTGAPEAAPKRLAQLEAEVHALEQAFGPTMPRKPSADDGFASTYLRPVVHVLWPLAVGRSMPVARMAFHEELVAACAEDRTPVVLVSSPAHLKRMPEALDWAATRGVVRAVFSSGGPLPPEGASDVMRHIGVSPIEVFGSSETGGIAWRQRAAGTTAGRRCPVWRGGCRTVSSRCARPTSPTMAGRCAPTGCCRLEMADSCWPVGRTVSSRSRKNGCR